MDHRDIKLLCLKNFTVIRKLDDSIFYGDDSQEKIADIMRGLSPFVSNQIPQKSPKLRCLSNSDQQVTFLNSVVMPDPSLDEDSSSEEEQDGDENDD